MANGRLKNMVLAAVTVLAVSGCAREGALDVSSGVGVSVTRSGCPAVAVPDYTGDITIFNPVTSTDASAIDVVANITNVRSTCNSEGARIYSEATFDVYASRTRPDGARTVTIPYYSTVVQGGTAVVAKRISNVTLQFADGAYRATGSGKAGAYVDADAARLPDEVIERLTRILHHPQHRDQHQHRKDDCEDRAVDEETGEIHLRASAEPAALSALT